MPEVKRLLVIDGNALVHRAYHALPPLNTKKGELVNAVYGFLLVLFKAIKDLQPEYIAATFDLAAPTFRHEQFKEYKAKRQKAPEELYQQLAKVKEVLTAFKIPVYEKEGFEADDLIGTIATQAPKKQAFPAMETIIVSGDMDNLQLVNKQTKVFALRKGIRDTVLYDEELVKEKYGGLMPSQLQDYRGLRGDPSDNIPGVTGIGEKIAIELLKEFGTLENLYEQIEQNSSQVEKIKPGVLQKLKSYKEQAFFSKQLAEIYCSVPIDFDLKNCHFGDYDQEKAKQALRNLEFFSLLNRMPQAEIVKASENQTTQDSTQKEPAVSTDSVKVLPDDIRPRSSKDSSRMSSPQAGSGQIKQQSSFGLLSSVRKTEFIGHEKVQAVLQEIDGLEKAGLLSPEISKVEKELTPLIQKMEQNGIKVDQAKLKQLSQKLGRKVQELEKEIFKKAGQVFNINSPSQVSQTLFEKLQISSLGLRKTPGGVVSTGADELRKLHKVHPIVDLILQHRELAKLKSGFVDALPKMIDQKTGRIHPVWHQLGTETGRISCSRPNLQNIPIKSDLGIEIRKCFIPEKGFQFLSADYSQIDLRVAAVLANDKKILALFRQGEDIHKMTASEVFEISKENVTKEQRALAKTLNFGILYGMGYISFSERTGIEKVKAKDFIKKYFEEFKGIAEYVKNAKEKAKQEGFSQTLFGRKRFLAEIDSLDPRLRAQAERMAVNLPVQGTVADIMKMAMVELKKQGLLSDNCRLLLQIHDELLLEIKKAEIPKLSLQVKSIMEKAGGNSPPLKVEIKTGKNWGELQ